VIEHVSIGRLATIVATLAVMLGLGIGSSAAQAKPAKVTHEPVSQATLAAEQAEQAAQETEEAAEATQEAAEAAEETAVLGARPAVSIEGTSRRHLTSSTRKINRLTREIRHLRHVKERIRAKIRELRELPGTSPRRGRGQLTRARAKLLQKRRRLFHLQQERSELQHP
jgi:polyhydroxyalkanoate synthesis regulator phasin